MSSTPKAKILVVDDDRLVLTTLVHGLEQAGYEVLSADNGDEAILEAREHRPQLALLDIRMEGKSGFDVAEVLRDKYGIPFMFLSAFADDATVRQVQALGAVAYLVKPLDIHQIVPAVEAALAQVAQAVRAAAGAERRAEDVAIAIGVLMHRHSLSRSAARAALARMAEQAERPVAEEARHVVDAVELLSRPAELH